MTTAPVNKSFRKVNVAAGLVFLLLFIPSYTGYSWSSTELTGMFSTHQFLTRMAYSYLMKHPMIRDHIIPFPTIKEIEAYCGVNVKLTNSTPEIYGEGPDNPIRSTFADHYYNPAFPGGGAGRAPDRINENFAMLRQDISAKVTNAETARSAAYLAHYIQDMTCPFHVIGAPPGDLSFSAEAIGPYVEKYGERTCVLKDNTKIKEVCANPVSYLVESNLQFFEQDVTGFWDMMVARYREDKTQGKNWFEPNYYNGHICPQLHTYLSTHFLYEAMVAHYHNNPEMETRFSNLPNINFLTNNWNSLGLSANRAGGFAIKLARFTKEDLDNYDNEFMFDPRELISYSYIGLKVLGYSGMAQSGLQKNIIEMKSTVPLPEKAWTRAIQATYTVWRASFSALYVDGENDVILYQSGINPDTYTARIKLTNYEPGETARNITAKLKQVSNGVAQDIGQAAVTELSNSQNGNSIWLEFKKSFALKESAEIEVEITGTFDKVPDAGSATYTSDKPALDPLGGTWSFPEANASIAILYNAATKQYEGRVIRKGDLAFHEQGAIFMSEIKPVETPVMTAQSVPGEIYYTGKEYSWEVISNPDGSFSRGPQNRLPASITVNGNTLTYRTKDDTFQFIREN